jgi:hypothetical protein
MSFVLDTMLPILKTNEISCHIYWVLFRYVVLGAFLEIQMVFQSEQDLAPFSSVACSSLTNHIININKDKIFYTHRPHNIHVLKVKKC